MQEYVRRRLTINLSPGSTKCNVATYFRTDCGADYEGIDEEYCVARRGCCWDENWKGGNNSGCYFDEGKSTFVIKSN